MKEYLNKFITQDNDYIIEFYLINNFFYSDRKIFNLVFKNILGNTLASINISDMNFFILLDTIYEFNENNEFNSDVISLVSIEKDYTYFIGFDTLIIYDKNNIPSSKDIFTLYSYCDDIMIKVLSFDITDTLNYFLDLLVNIYYDNIDENLNEYISYNASFYSNNNP